MAIDPYAPCPGGTGKKIKFCCSDLHTELDKIQRMLEGDQRAACLDLIESLEAKYPDRACLLSIKGMLEAQLGQEEKAEATLARFSKLFPDNPVALAESATLAAMKDGGLAGVAPLQEAIEKTTEQLMPPVYDAIGIIGQSLVAENRILAGRAHLMLQLGLSGGQDKSPLDVIVRINASPAIPLWDKQDLPMSTAPDDALWKSPFEEALAPTFRGAWRLGERKLSELADKVGRWPAILRNIAILRTIQANNEGAVAAWREYAAGPVPLDDAVEAELMAQVLDPSTLDTVDVITLPFEVNDTDALQARLAANPRSPQMPIDLSRLTAVGEPPPRGAYWLLDKPLASDGKELTRDQISRVVGQVFLFGKQTDRAARLEMVSYRTELDQAMAVIREIGGDALGKTGTEDATTQVPLLEHVLSWNWRLPEGTPTKKRLELMAEERNDSLLKRWPEMPQKLFDGKSASQVASDASHRIKLLAAILRLELSTDRTMGDFDFNALRQKLGLPPAETIDPSKINVQPVSLLRYARVDVKKLTDDQLLQLYRQAEVVRNYAALRPLAREVVGRESLDKRIEKDQVHGQLAQLEPDLDEAVAHLDCARRAAEELGKSTAPWDLSELAMRIAQGDVANADRLLHHIRDEHIREPGVAQALFQILSDAGIISPDGKPAVPAGAAPAAPGIVVPGAAAPEEPGKIWTPGSDQPSGKKSALWTPGMQ